MKQNFKDFLESPNTLEPVSGTDIEKVQHSMLQRSKLFALANKRRKKIQKLPPFVPLKSIYEEQDLSKLTERQRILALKFQTVKDKASSLFLAVNNIKTVHPETKNENTCQNCISDVNSLCSFVSWLADQHCCSNKKKLQKIFHTLKSELNCKNCLCDKEELIYSKVTKFLGLKCCKN